MSFQGLNQLAPADLSSRLAEGWTVEHPDVAREFVARLRRRWHADVRAESAGVSAFTTLMQLNQLRLLGASELGCLILSNGADVERQMNAFWRQHGGSGRLALVLASTKEIKKCAQRFAPSGHCVFLGDSDVEALVTHSHPLELLKEHLRRHIPLRRLLPYDITHPVAPNMFFGRRDILDRFHQEETTSFAVAGPGRIGKSSLLKQYRYELCRNGRDDRRHRLFLIDCYPYARLSADDLARRIALDISADSEANRINAKTLLRFLKRHSREGEQPLELLFDEVDAICRSETTDELAEAVRTGYCRVILCGKGNLYGLMRRRESQFAKRLELVRPEPLDADSAGKLLLEPLGDLGIMPDDEPALCQCVFELTARRPHLIQETGKILFQLAETDHTRRITMQHLQRLREKFMEMSHAMLPLDDMQDDFTRLLILLLLRDGDTEVTVDSLQRLAERHGLVLRGATALDICDDLWICNVLTWENGKLSLANPHLIKYVRNMQFGSEIRRLKYRIADRAICSDGVFNPS